MRSSRDPDFLARPAARPVAAHEEAHLVLRALGGTQLMQCLDLETGLAKEPQHVPWERWKSEPFRREQDYTLDGGAAAAAA
jgi:hypothetical protein